MERAPAIADAGVIDAPASSIFDVTGRFLLAVATPIAPDTPLQFISNNTLTPRGDGTADLVVRVQALRADGRTPLDMVYTGTGIVDAQGHFSVNVGTVMVPGEANPISGGDIVATLTLEGTIASKDRLCGTIKGMLTQPFMGSLDGSLWGAIRVSDTAVGAALPAPDVTCPLSVMPDAGLDSGTD